MSNTTTDAQNPTLSDQIRTARNAFITHTTEPTFDTPREINNGGCAAFAGIVATTTDRDIDVHRADLTHPEAYIQHYFLTYEGTHYDAETPNGVNEPYKLPFIKTAFRTPWNDEQRLTISPTAPDCARLQNAMATLPDQIRTTLHQL